MKVNWDDEIPNISGKVVSGWWLGHPSEKYESIGMMRFPIVMGKLKIDGNQSPPTRFVFAPTPSVGSSSVTIR